MNRLWIALAILTPVFAQEHVAVPLADANRPVSLSITLMHGSVTIRGSNGHGVIIDSKGGAPRENQKTYEGLHRIGGGADDISIQSENNQVTILSHGDRSGGLTVETPVNTSLNVKAMTGQVTIDGVSGEIDVQALNGALTIRNASGPVVANSLNGGMTVTMAGVKAGSPMSFTSLNGNIDVTLPANVAANFNMKTNHGDIYSDFDVNVKSSPKPFIEQKDGKGKYTLKSQGTVTGSVNGGGPEYRFSTLNGNIYIRKKLN